MKIFIKNTKPISFTIDFILGISNILPSSVDTDKEILAINTRKFLSEYSALISTQPLLFDDISTNYTFQEITNLPDDIIIPYKSFVTERGSVTICMDVSDTVIAQTIASILYDKLTDIEILVLPEDCQEVIVFNTDNDNIKHSLKYTTSNMIINTDNKYTVAPYITKSNILIVRMVMSYIIFISLTELGINLKESRTSSLAGQIHLMGSIGVSKLYELTRINNKTQQYKKFL